MMNDFGIDSDWANLHNHSTWSDGVLTIRNLLTEASRIGLAAIAVTDHLETMKTNSIPLSELEHYIQECRLIAQEQEFRHIRVFVGVEIDTHDLITTRKQLPFNLLNQLDLILFEYVEEHSCYGMDLNTFFSIRNRLTIPVGLAHNDILLNFPSYSPRTLAKLFSHERIFVELNSSYSRLGSTVPYYRYAQHLFEEAHRFPFFLSIGSDTHLYPGEVRLINEPYQFLKSIGCLDMHILKKNKLLF